MDLQIKKEVEDIRGKIIFLTYGKDGQINIIETKKRFSRGGHYHKRDTDHILISGKIEYREEDIKVEMN